MINVNIYNAKEEGKTGPKSQGYSLCELQSCTFDFIAIYNISTAFFKIKQCGFCLQTYISSLGYKFNTGLETYLRDFGPY